MISQWTVVSVFNEIFNFSVSHLFVKYFFVLPVVCFLSTLVLSALWAAKFFGLQALWSSQNVFGPPTAGCVVVDFKDRAAMYNLAVFSLAAYSSCTTLQAHHFHLQGLLLHHLHRLHSTLSSSWSALGFRSHPELSKSRNATLVFF